MRADRPVVARADGDVRAQVVVGGAHAEPGEQPRPDAGAVRVQVVAQARGELPGVHAVPQDHLRDVRHAPGGHGLDGLGPVGADAQRLVEACTALAEAIQVEGHRPGDELRLEEGPGPDGGVVRGVVPDVSRRGVPVAPRDHAAADEHQAGVALEGPELEGEPVGRGLVVGVQDGEVAPAREVDPGVERGRLPPVAVHADEAHARIPPRQAGHDRRGPVRRPVVDDHHLEVAGGLDRERRERRADVGRGVVGRHDDRHEGPARPGSTRGHVARRLPLPGRADNRGATRVIPAPGPGSPGAASRRRSAAGSGSGPSAAGR